MRVYKCKRAQVHIEYGPRLRCLMLEDHQGFGGKIGEWTLTSQLKSIDFERGVAITQNSIYVWEV